MSKIAVVGAGNVGATVAYCVAEKNLGEIVMVDVAPGLAQAKALDFLQASPLRRYDVEITGTDDYCHIRDADVVVLTAGVPRKPGMDRMDLLKTNVGIAKVASQAMAEYCPNATVVVVSNPLDVICMAVLRETGFAVKRVVGMAGVLDTTRFRYFIAERLGVWPGDVSALVLGGHGDTMVPLKGYAAVGGLPLTELLPDDEIEELIQRTRDGGAEIVGLLKTGSAFYSPGASAAKMVEAIVRDEKRLLPAAACLRGEYAHRDLFLGVPVILGVNGVERILELPLNPQEQAQLDASAAAVAQGVASLETFFSPG